VRKIFASSCFFVVDTPSGTFTFFKKSAGRTGSSQRIEGIGAGVWVGAVVAVAVGGSIALCGSGEVFANG